MKGDDNSAGLSIPALFFRKLSANSIPRQLSSHPFCNASSRNPPTVRNRDCAVVNAIRFFRCRPRSSSKSVFEHCRWNASKIFSESRHLAVICASARSEPRSLAPSELTRTKISVTSS